jgi:hypothetical protein
MDETMDETMSVDIDELNRILTDFNERIWTLETPTTKKTFVPIGQYAVETSALRAKQERFQQGLGIQLKNLTQALRDTVPGFSDRYDELRTSAPKSVPDSPAHEVS